jgi:hypothetical protein
MKVITTLCNLRHSKWVIEFSSSWHIPLPDLILLVGLTMHYWDPNAGQDVGCCLCYLLDLCGHSRREWGTRWDKLLLTRYSSYYSRLNLCGPHQQTYWTSIDNCQPQKQNNLSSVLNNCSLFRCFNVYFELQLQLLGQSQLHFKHHAGSQSYYKGHMHAPKLNLFAETPAVFILTYGTRLWPTRG